jgi:hypothetical protein
MMRIGIEHEFVFKDDRENYLDFETADYGLFQKIVDEFPYIEGDDMVFECKSLEQKPKRCYIEGFERYDFKGKAVETIPKGLEIRTLPHERVAEVLQDFTTSYLRAMKIVKSFGFSPLLTSMHPFKTAVVFEDPLNDTEITLRTKEQLAVATNALLWHGLHVNVSIEGFSKEEMADLLQKVNYYAPYIIPFSFSSPFYGRTVFEGLSCRAYLKAETRKVAELQSRNEVDVIEFRGYDSCGDVKLLQSLLVLFKGLLLDKTLKKRAVFQDSEMVKRCALKGFEDETIRQEALHILHAVKNTMKEEEDTWEYLQRMLLANDSYAVRMKQDYQKTGDIMQSISNRYCYGVQ